MYITYRDYLGYTSIAVNEYGITFDQEKRIAILEDASGKEYRIAINDILQISKTGD